MNVYYKEQNLSLYVQENPMNKISQLIIKNILDYARRYNKTSSITNEIGQIEKQIQHCYVGVEHETSQSHSLYDQIIRNEITTLNKKKELCQMKLEVYKAYSDRMSLITSLLSDAGNLVPNYIGSPLGEKSPTWEQFIIHLMAEYKLNLEFDKRTLQYKSQINLDTEKVVNLLCEEGFPTDINMEEQQEPKSKEPSQYFLQSLAKEMKQQFSRGIKLNDLIYDADRKLAPYKLNRHQQIDWQQFIGFLGYHEPNNQVEKEQTNTPGKKSYFFVEPVSLDSQIYSKENSQKLLENIWEIRMLMGNGNDQNFLKNFDLNQLSQCQSIEFEELISPDPNKVLESLGLVSNKNSDKNIDDNFHKR